VRDGKRRRGRGEGSIKQTTTYDGKKMIHIIDGGAEIAPGKKKAQGNRVK